MKKLLPFLVAVAFLLRGFVGDAMAVGMIGVDFMSMQPSATQASTAASCHDMGMLQGEKTDAGKSSPDHQQCQWCCVMAAVPATPVFDIGAFEASSPDTFTASLSSNDLLPAFKPPIL